MKKYTNKIFIIVLIAFVLAFTVRFLIISNDIKKEMKQSESIEININN